jgi:D-cysteine desulfhydrase
VTRVQPLDLARTPTPVRRLDLPDLAGRLWVKDEGASGEVYGGNKVRKLRWVLADALSSGRHDLVTVGGVGSHHVLATALLGAEVGLRTHAVLFRQPDTPHVRHVGGLLGARLASHAPLEDPLSGAAAVTALYARVAAEAGRPYRIPVGGSSTLGTLGWIEAALELAQQVRAGELPPPRRVYVAVGSGGTAAGLCAGLALAGLDAEVVGVRVVSRAVANRPRIRALARRASQAWGGEGRLAGLRLVHDWYCGAYGRYEPRVVEAVERGRAVGLELETTYTGKALGACLEELAVDGVDAVFVQSVSTRPLPEAPPLPADLGALLTSR